MGVGHDATTSDWSPLEDFRWHDDLVAFLDHISTVTSNHAHLLILGDFLELWQSIPEPLPNGVVERYTGGDCIGAGPQRGCSELEENVRVERVIREHKPTLVALGEFACHGDNKLTIAPGNHDAALLIPSIAQNVLAALAGACGRVELMTQGFWLSPDGNILAEHGHQFDRVNSFRSWPTPYTTDKGELRMERPWGEYMVQQFYNRYEMRFPTIDNLGTEADGVRYALSTLHAGGTITGAGEFLKFLALETSLQQKIDFLGAPEEGSTPKWDVASVRKHLDAQFLLSSIDKDDPAYAALSDAYRRNPTPIDTSDLEDADIESICDTRVLLAEKYRQRKVDRIVQPCPQLGPANQPRMGYVLDKLLKRDRKRMVAHIKDVTRPLRLQEGVGPVRPQMYVYGHTHVAKSPDRIQIATGWYAYSANTGAFQRLADAAWLQQIIKDRKLDDAHVLPSLTVADLRPCYTFVTVKEGAPPESLRLRAWKLSDSHWVEEQSCN
jgi:UDP-2,3-diacylglucosamine pyrophosphatase LpxH